MAASFENLISSVIKNRFTSFFHHWMVFTLRIVFYFAPSFVNSEKRPQTEIWRRYPHADQRKPTKVLIFISATMYRILKYLLKTELCPLGKYFLYWCRNDDIIYHFDKRLIFADHCINFCSLYVVSFLLVSRSRWVKFKMH